MKMKRNLGIFVVLFLLAGCGNKPAGSEIVRFKGGSLTAADLTAHYQIIKRQPNYRSNPEMLTPEFVYNHALNMEMLLAKGLDEKLHLDPRIRQEIHHFMSDLFLKVMQDKLVPSIDKESITEEEMRAYYEAHKGNYQQPALFTVRLIALEDQAAAADIYQQLSNKVLSFAEAAQRWSTDKDSASRGGRIGTRSLAKFRPSWRSVVETLKTGRVSAPVPIGQRWYLFELTEKTQPVQYTFEEKKAYIHNDVLYARYRQAWEATYTQLKKEFGVKVDPQRLQAFYDAMAPVNNQE